MKTRRIVVTLEIDTDCPLPKMKRREDWDCSASAYYGSTFKVNQVQINVVEAAKPVKPTRKRS